MVALRDIIGARAIVQHGRGADGEADSAVSCLQHFPGEFLVLERGVALCRDHECRRRDRVTIRNEVLFFSRQRGAHVGVVPQSDEPLAGVGTRVAARTR